MTKRQIVRVVKTRTPTIVLNVGKMQIVQRVRFVIRSPLNVVRPHRVMVMATARKARSATRRPINASMPAVVRAKAMPIVRRASSVICRPMFVKTRVVVPTMETAQLMSCVISRRVNVSPDAMETPIARLAC